MITRRIFEWAERAPGKVALAYNGHDWTYADYAQAIAMGRGFFARRGIGGPGLAVLVIYDLRYLWVLSLALRSLGLTTLAVPSPEAMVELGLTGVRCVITSPAEAWTSLPGICAEARLELISVSLADEAPLDLPGRDDIAPGGHIMLTSGTTGTHKQVLIEPGFEAAYGDISYRVRTKDETTVDLAFDFAAWTAAGYMGPSSTWIHGGTIVLQQGAGSVVEGLRRPGLTHAVMVPTMLARALAAPEGAYPRHAGMRLSILGGSITEAELAGARARITPLIYNNLGATEASVFGYTLLETPEDRRWHRIAPGRRVEIVGEDDRPLPTGQVGRVRVENRVGPQAYLDDPEAGAEMFRDGYFYPGDLGVMRADGRMALEGRVTDVINIGGSKVSPAPLEERLREMLGVRGVCLFSMQNADGEEEAHLVLEADTPVDAARLRAALEATLKGFAMARVHYLATLPRNAMGKVARSRVRELLVAWG